MVKQITFSQYWYLVRKIITNKNSGATAMYIDSEGVINNIEYFNARVKILISCSGLREITVQIKTFGDVEDEITSTIKLPLFQEFSPSYWLWKYMRFVVNRAWIKDNKHKVNEDVQKINELIAQGFPEDIEKELLK